MGGGLIRPQASKQEASKQASKKHAPLPPPGWRRGGRGWRGAAASAGPAPGSLQYKNKWGAGATGLENNLDHEPLNQSSKHARPSKASHPPTNIHTHKNLVKKRTRDVVGGGAEEARGAVALVHGLELARHGRRRLLPVRHRPVLHNLGAFFFFFVLLWGGLIWLVDVYQRACVSCFGDVCARVCAGLMDGP